jgi:hypothetical protein
MTRRYRIDCTNCRWHGYRSNAYDCECYEYPCRPTSPGIGCPNGANLYVVCPHCGNLRIAIEKNSPRAYRDRGKILVRETWSRKHTALMLRSRGRLRREQTARDTVPAVTG